MNENYKENEHDSQTDLNLNRVREKLAQAVEIWSEQLPNLMNQSKGKVDMKAQLMLNTFRPFLPKLQDSLKTSIESASDEQILVIMEKVEEILEWLKADN